MLKKLFHIFWTAPGARPVLVTTAICFSSLSDLLGMGALVPLASQMSADKGATNSWLGQGVMVGMSQLGIEPTFTHLLIFLGLALVMKSLIAFLAMRFVAISVANVATGIRTQLLKTTMDAKWSYFVDHQPGEVAAMVAAQSQMAGDAYFSVANLVVTTIVGLGLLLTAFLVSGPLVLFCLFAVAALALPLYYILRRAQAASLKQFSTSTNLATGVQDVIANMKALKSMARQGRFVDAFMKSIGDLRGAVITMMVSRHAIYHGQDILGALMIISGVYVGAVVLHTPLSQLLVVGVIFYQLVDVIKRVQLSLQDATVASAGYYGVFAIINKAAAEVETDTGTGTPTLLKGIALEKVGFAYHQTRVLNNINITIPANEITVLIGQSGAGKTTIVDMIIGFNRPQQGRVLIDGQDLAGINLKTWRSMIGYVPQELTLLRGSVFDNITLGDPGLLENDVLEALRLAGAAEFIAALPQGVHTNIGTMGAKLSGGQRQRLSLARALVNKPKLLLLDEVTSALDEATEAEICRNIQELQGKLTIIAITHRPAWTKVATKVYAVAEGKAKEAARMASQPVAAMAD